MFVYVYMCMYAYICVCIYVCMCVYMYIYLCMYVYICAYVYMYIYVCVFLCTVYVSRVVAGDKSVPLRSMHVVKGDQNGYPVTGGVAESPCPGVINKVEWSSRLWVGRKADNLSP